MGTRRLATTRRGTGTPFQSNGRGSPCEPSLLFGQTVAFRAYGLAMDIEVEVVLRVLLAGVLGAAVGFDRQRANKPAGLRTHMLVSMGAALFAGTALVFVDRFVPDSAVRLDILRVVAAVATGVGFLGAGAILRAGGEVRGLTTAAGIWVTAGIGLAAGLGQLVVAVGATVLAVIVIAVLGGDLVPGLATNEASTDEEA